MKRQAAADTDGDYPARAAPAAQTIAELDAALIRCRACPRLVSWREQVAATPRSSFRDWSYWGRPVPGFGPADAPLLIIGLAPAAHGANRTGRMFTGDRSGDFLFSGLHSIGLASQPTSSTIGDGLRLAGVRISAGVHCAPPINRPSPSERDTCRSWLRQEIALMREHLRSIVVLGEFGWTAVLPVLRADGWLIPRPAPRFGHGARLELQPTGPGAPLTLFGSYHVSQQNTFTGRLTAPMLEEVLSRAATQAGLRPCAPPHTSSAQ